MKKCAFLSMDNLEDFECYDYLTFEPLQQLGWQVEEVSWRKKDPDWNQYDLVVIRSPWDYQQNADAFVRVLKDIEKSSAVLQNSLAIVEWNINKQYLRELESKGVEIVPSLWRNNITAEELTNFFTTYDTPEIIIKPCISANADDTFRLTESDLPKSADQLIKTFNNRDCMIQPFMPSVINEGEFSLFYFNGQYSHSILKTPATNDFRVQEEHGGRLKKIEPEAELLAAAERTLKAIDSTLLYARLDYVRSDSGFALMEAELIEPSLYFYLDPKSPIRFAEAVDNYFQSL